MGRSREQSATSPERVAAYQWYQREKPHMLRKSATILETWRSCERSACRRGKACLGEDARICLRHLIQVEMTEVERQIFFGALTLRAGGLDGKAAWAEASRRVAQQMAAMEGLGFPATAG